MGEIIMRNWILTEFRVRVNSPSPIRQVLVPIWRVITVIRGLQNPVRQVVPQISPVHLYTPYHTHLNLPSLSFSSTTLTSLQEHKVISSLSISRCHHHGSIPSAAYAECTFHRVRHTPRIVCHGFILSISSWPLNVASASGVPPYRSTATS